MSTQPPPNNEGSETGEFETGEFETGEFDRSGVHSKTGTHRRRRRRKSKKKKSNPIVLQLLGFLLFSALLVGIGVIVGSANNTSELDSERSRIAAENRRVAQQKWFAECEGNGNSRWTCEHFDRAHFEVAKRLDGFSCADDLSGYQHCTYVLGKATVSIIIPVTGKIDGEIRVSRRRPRTVVEYSDKSNDNYIGISSNGRIEFRKKDQTTPTFVINPVTGVLHELETDTIARLEH